MLVIFYRKERSNLFSIVFYDNFMIGSTCYNKNYYDKIVIILLLFREIVLNNI